jgi:hypothetical protein
MNLFSTLLAGASAVGFIAMIFFVIFGQVTVRKLRKNPKTKDELGIELASGWDILNVAGALARPEWLSRKLKNTPLGYYLYANTEVLFNNTNTFDRVLATVFYILYVFSGTSLILLVTLNAIGVFD